MPPATEAPVLCITSAQFNNVEAYSAKLGDEYARALRRLVAALIQEMFPTATVATFRVEPGHDDFDADAALLMISKAGGELLWFSKDAAEHRTAAEAIVAGATRPGIDASTLGCLERRLAAAFAASGEQVFPSTNIRPLGWVYEIDIPLALSWQLQLDDLANKMLAPTDNETGSTRI